MLGERDRQAAAQGREDGRLRRHVLGRQRRAAPEGHRGRDQGPQHRDRRQEGGQHRPRQGALERRRRHQRAPRPEPGRAACGPTTARRSPPRSRPAARRARCWPRCSTRRTARSTASQPASSSAPCVQKPFQFGYLSQQVDARPGDQGRRRQGCPPGRQIIDTGVDVINKDNVDDVPEEAGGDEGGRVTVADDVSTVPHDCAASAEIFECARHRRSSASRLLRIAAGDARHHQALPRRGGAGRASRSQLRARRGARADGRERRRQEHADEDPRRRLSAGRGRDLQSTAQPVALRRRRRRQAAAASR